MTTSITPFPATYEEIGEVVVVVAPSVFASHWMGTSDHLGLTAGYVLSPIETTEWSIPAAVTIGQNVAAEVLELRDRITWKSGLTRQDVARALGVDRRSLSGFVTGEIRPTESRLAALRLLARVVDSLQPDYGERVRDILRSELPQGSVLDAIASGRIDVSADMDAAVTQVVTGPRVSVRRRAHREPLYLKARERWSDRLDLPSAGGTVRDPAVYEQDISAVVPAHEPMTSTRPRRKQL